MKWLIALLATIGAGAVAFFFWRKHHQSANSLWNEAKDSTSSLSKAAAEKAGAATEKVAASADKMTDAASDVAEDVEAAVRRGR